MTRLLSTAREATRGHRWSVEDVGTDAVANALNALLREADQGGGDHKSLRTMNLVVAPDPHRANAHKATLTQTAQHPARLIRLVEHEPDRLDAEVRVRAIEIGDSGMEVLVEDVEIHASRSRLEHADSLIAPLLARGLPTVAWLPGYGQDRKSTRLNSSH